MVSKEGETLSATEEAEFDAVAVALGAYPILGLVQQRSATLTVTGEIRERGRVGALQVSWLIGVLEKDC